MGRIIVKAEAYEALVGCEIGVSGWFEISQALVDRFADVTEDFQFIHVSPDRAAATPFGGTIAHGFLPLSLLSAMAAQALPVLAGERLSINYGFNKIRFMAPVRTGKRVRARFGLIGLNERNRGEFVSTIKVTIEIQGEEKPALVAEWLILSMIEACPCG